MQSYFTNLQCSISFYSSFFQNSAIKQEDVPDVKKLKVDTEIDGLEKQIKEQNEIMFKYRDKLKNSLNKKQMIELLEYNGQEIPVGEDRVSFFCFERYTLL